MLLPDPDGPTMNVHDPARHPERHAPQGLDDLVPALERLADVDGLDHHGTPPRVGRMATGSAVESRHVTLCRIASIGVIRDAFQAG